MTVLVRQGDRNRENPASRIRMRTEHVKGSASFGLNLPGRGLAITPVDRAGKIGRGGEYVRGLDGGHRRGESVARDRLYRQGRVRKYGHRHLRQVVDHGGTPVRCDNGHGDLVGLEYVGDVFVIVSIIDDETCPRGRITHESGGNGIGGEPSPQLTMALVCAANVSELAMNSGSVNVATAVDLGNAVPCVPAIGAD